MKISLLRNKPNVICSIDASTNNFAYAIFRDGDLIAFDKILFSGASVFNKILSAVNQSYDRFKDHDLDAIIIEHAVFMNSPKTMYDLSVVQGAILAGISLATKAKVYSTNPIAWQSFIGNGRISKEDRAALQAANPDKSSSWYKQQEREIRKQKTINFVNISYDLQIADHDIADAIGIGHYAWRNWDKLGD